MRTSFGLLLVLVFLVEGTSKHILGHQMPESEKVGGLWQGRTAVALDPHSAGHDSHEGNDSENEVRRKRRWRRDDDLEKPKFPRLSTESELTINTTAQTSWSISCQAEYDYPWSFDNIYEDQTSESSTGPDENGILNSTLTIHNLHPDNTGFIYCESASTYVYFDDGKQEVIVGSHEYDIPVGYHNLDFYCRPTNPKYEIVLKKDGKIVTNSSSARKGGRWTFNPHEGFSLDVVMWQDGGVYHCNDDPNEISVNIVGDPIHKPAIMLREACIVEGFPFVLECMIDFTKEVRFSWTYPDTIESPEESSYNEGDRRYSLLKVKNATKQHSGNYTCHVASAMSKNENVYAVEVKNKDFASFLNFSNHAPTIPLKEGRSGPWIISYKSFPPNITVDWLFEGQPKVNKRIDLKIDRERVKLTLKNASTEDFGNYTLRGITSDGKAEDMVNCFIFIKNKPRISLEQTFVIPKGETIKIKAEVIAYPVPNIEWLFQPCPPDTECQDFRQIEAYQQGNQKNSVESSVEVGKTSGVLWCKAVNELGTAEAKAFITVTDVGATFFFNRTHNENQPSRIDGRDSDMKVVEGDTIHLRCGAIKFEYENLTLYIPQTSTLMKNEESTPLTAIQSASAANVSITDSGNYICSSTVRPELSSVRKNMSYSLRLIVKALSAPKFMDDANVQPNGTNIKLDITEQILFKINCTVEGTPKPHVNWTKDGVPFEPLPMTDNPKPGKRYCIDDDCQRIELYVIESSDAGEYHCTAKNRVGVATASINVVLERMPGNGGLMEWMIALLVLALVFVAALVVTLLCYKKPGNMYEFDRKCREELNKDILAIHQADLLPYDKSWEIDRSNIEVESQIGCGFFGRVMKGKLLHPGTENPPTTVAIKMSKISADVGHLQALESELKIMCHLGQHLNIVNLVGASTVEANKGKLWILVEFCLHGDLLGFIQKHRQQFIDQVDPETGKFKPEDMFSPFSPLSFSRDSAWSAACCSPSTLLSPLILEDSRYTQTTFNKDSNSKAPPEHFVWTHENSTPEARDNVPGETAPLTTSSLVCWAWQIAQGMNYLAHRKILHSDLALRNILLAHDNVVKISDFGLARDICLRDVYQKETSEAMPVKWMSVEAIRDRIFSTQSDVWAFGIVLWELFSLGSSPYPGIDISHDFFKKLDGGYRMEKPRYADEEIYGIMRDCWEKDPMSRPRFNVLCDRFSLLLYPDLFQHYMKMNQPHEEQNKKKFEDGNDLLVSLASPDYEALGGSFGDRQGSDYVNISATDTNPRQDSTYLMMRSPTHVVYSSGGREEQGIFSPRLDSESQRFVFDKAPLRDAACPQQSREEPPVSKV